MTGIEFLEEDKYVYSIWGINGSDINSELGILNTRSNDIEIIVESNEIIENLVL